MTDRDLRKMNRKELLELLIALEKENGELKEFVRQQEVQLQSRTLLIENTGSLAEAALAVNDVFKSADRAAAQYLENIKYCSEQQEIVYNRIVSEAEQKAKAIIADAEMEKQQRIKAADDYWQTLSAKLEAFCQSHTELLELLSIKTSREKSEAK